MFEPLATMNGWTTPNIGTTIRSLRTIGVPSGFFTSEVIDKSMLSRTAFYEKE